jgi:DsbC/DsbD-like thiol-disulfide interchange protein
MMMLGVRVLFTLAAAAIPVSAVAQPLNPVRWSVQAAPSAVTAGQIARIQVAAQIDEGWHLYALEQAEKGPLPTELTAGPEPAFTMRQKEIESPEPQRTQDPNFGVETAWYADSAVFTLPVEVAANVAAGARVIEVRARFQACNATLCLRPATVTLSVKITVAKRQR